MIAFIEDHKMAHGVEPICRVLPIAPSLTRQANCVAILLRGHVLCSRGHCP